MLSTALGHRLETLHDGLTTFHDGDPVPVPLLATSLSIRVRSGLAFVRTTRTFRNAEAHPIEAVMTFPIGFDAVVTGLAATIDGRRMIGVAKERAEARETYEAALDEGKLSVLHEEALRGIHILSVGALPPGAEVSVELEQTVPLVDAGGVPFLRLPMTAGQLYGTSPLLPSDDLVTADVRHAASLSVTVDAGRALLHGTALAPDQTVEILLDRAVELRIEGGSFGQLVGTAADGRKVTLTLEPVGSGDASLDLHVIVDRSGSTHGSVQDGPTTVWQAMRDGLAAELATLRPSDRVALWQFDSDCQCLGRAQGPASADLVDKLDGPRGGTELAGAIRAALAQGARDILVLTDGQTWAHLVEDLKGEGPRISAILVGPRSFDANIGHLCALTGGQVLFAPGRDVASALRSAFAALRQSGAAVQGERTEAGPARLTALRAGVRLRADWSTGQNDETPDSLAVGRFAAALALPLLPTGQAETFARAHSLCTHMTSLVLVDDAEEATEGFSRMRKVPLMAAMAAPSSAMELRSAERSSMQAHSLSAMPRYSASIDDTDVLMRRRSASGGPGSTPPDLDLGGGDPSPAFREVPLRKGMFKRAPTLPDGAEPSLDLTMFEGFAWDAHGDALLAGDLSALSRAQRAIMEGLAKRIQAARPSSAAEGPALGDVTLIALGLIALRSGGRAAERFARRVLNAAPPWLLAIS